MTNMKLSLTDDSDEKCRIYEEKIISFIRDSVSGSGSDGIVMGLSGGIDSALAAALAVRALGSDRVLGIFFYDSSKTPDPSVLTDHRDVRDLCDFLETDFLTIDIRSVMTAAKDVIAAAKTSGSGAFCLPGNESRLVSGNMRARLFMAILYTFANRMNRLVAGTTNRTELMIGYFTKFGDGAADIEPVGDLYKTEVRILAKHMGIPAHILEKAPSAGFFEGQSDEADLGITYDVLDRILELYAAGESRETILKETGISGELYGSVEKRILSSAHKRNMPPAPPVH